MNGTLAHAIRRQLMPALEQSQGFAGVYSRAGSNRQLTVIPTKPEWMAEEQQGAAILQWKGLVFEVSQEAWSATGFDVPQLNDRLTVTLADGVQQTYALSPPKGHRPYEQSADSTVYFLNMKQVSA
jgi:hypothetical protein